MLKNKRISVRSTQNSFDKMKELSSRLALSNSDIIEMALNFLDNNTSMVTSSDSFVFNSNKNNYFNKEG